MEPTTLAELLAQVYGAPTPPVPLQYAMGSQAFNPFAPAAAPAEAPPAPVAPVAPVIPDVRAELAKANLAPPVAPEPMSGFTPDFQNAFGMPRQDTTQPAMPSPLQPVAPTAASAPLYAQPVQMPQAQPRTRPETAQERAVRERLPRFHARLQYLQRVRDRRGM